MMVIERKIVGPVAEFKGKRVFIVGSGPSLDEIELSRLQNSIVFALNASATLFDLSAADRVHWFARDRRIGPECLARLLGPHTLRMVAGIRAWEQVTDTARRQNLSGLVYDERHVVHERTVAEDALQIAKRLGAAEAVLVGVDCHAPPGQPYAKALDWKEPHWYDRKNPPKSGAESKACASMLKALKSLAASGKLDGLRVRTCSKTCDAFEYVSFDEIMEEPESGRERKRRAARAV
jgi:hypothetical protein